MRGRIVLALVGIALAVGIVAVTPSLAFAVDGAVSGQVTDAGNGFPAGGNGVPIANALVTPIDSGGTTLTALAVVTDAQGNYFINLPPDTGYSLWVQRGGYHSAVVPGVTVVGGSTTTTNVALDAVLGSITGTVTADGQPVPGVAVAASLGGSLVESTTTDVNGAFTLADLRFNTYSIAFYKVGYNDASVLTNPGNPLGVSLSLVKGPGGVDGMLTSAGAPIALASVVLRDFNGIERGLAQTDVFGMYSISGVPVGTGYSLTFAKLGYRSRTITGVTIPYVVVPTVDAILDPWTRNTSTSLSAPAAARLGQKITLQGSVWPGSPSGQVVITKRRLVGGRWRTVGSSTVTLSDGAFSYVFRPSAKGRWRASALYAGGVVGPWTLLPSRSPIRTTIVR